MSNPITIQVPVAGQPNSTEDPKIASNFSNLQAWFSSPGITSSDLANGAITATQLATDAVTTAKIKDSTGSSDGVTTSKIATSAVTEAKLASGSVTTDKVGSTAVARSNIRVFTVPAYVTTLPQTITGSGTFTSGSTSVTFGGTSATPVAGQAFSGTNVASDTVITAVSGSSGSWTLTLNRATTGASSGTYTVAPQGGDEVYYKPGTAGGYPSTGVSLPIWHLRYDSSASNWQFVGGNDLILCEGYGTSTGAVTVTTPWQFSSAFSISNIPNAGEYEVSWSVDLKSTSAGTTATGGYAALAAPAITNGVISSTTQTSLALSSATANAALNPQNAGTIKMSTEIATYSGPSSNTLTLTRGSSPISSLATGSTVYVVGDNEAAGSSIRGATGAALITDIATVSRTVRKQGLPAGATFQLALKRGATGTTDVTGSNLRVSVKPVTIA